MYVYACGGLTGFVDTRRRVWGVVNHLMRFDLGGSRGFWTRCMYSGVTEVGMSWSRTCGTHKDCGGDVRRDLEAQWDVK